MRTRAIVCSWRADVEALATSEGRAVTSLGEWADRARQLHDEAVGVGVSGSSTAELVIEDRARRSRPGEARAGR